MRSTFRLLTSRFFACTVAAALGLSSALPATAQAPRAANPPAGRSDAAPAAKATVKNVAKPADNKADNKAAKAPANAAAAKPGSPSRTQRVAAQPAPPPPLPAASAEQLLVASLVHVGGYDCEFKQSVEVAPNARDAGYFDVRLGKQSWVMKPVLSSTGARRLEDVQGRMLMLQIAYKSMLMDVQVGRRLVDDCVHAEHRVAMRLADEQAVIAGTPGRSAAGTLFGGAEAPASRTATTTTTAAAAGGPVAIAAAVAATSSGGTALKLRILETSDLHMNLLGYDYYQDKPAEDYGLERTATLIKTARAEVRNTLLFDNGDLLQGNPLGDTVARIKPLQPGQVHPAFKVMNALRYDAGNIGNHEFNYGLPFLQQALSGAAFPYVNANIVADDGRGASAEAKNVFTPYVILERSFTDESGAVQALKIGVVGFVPPQVLQWDRQHLQGRVLARDIPETARALVPRIKAEGADVVVVIAHSGFERGETVSFAENTVARLAEVPGVDAVLFGHSHGEFPGRFFAGHAKVDMARGTINGVPATMPGFWGSHLGVIDLTLQKVGTVWTVADSRAELRPVYDRAARQPLVVPDPMVAELIGAEHQAALAYVRTEVASTSAAIHSYFAQVADDPSVQVVSEAQLAYARRVLAGNEHAALPLLSAAAPFKTGGRGGAGNYTDIAAGPIAVRSVADLYVYPNTVNIVRLSGAQVREWLEMAAGAFNRIDPAGAPEQSLVNAAFPSYNFDTLDGVTYRIDVTQAARYDRNGKLVAPAAQRITDLRHGGQPVDDKTMFAVVTNNYRASGGGGFPGLDGSNIIFSSADENREALLQYLRDTQRINPAADNNWRIVAVPGIKLRFTSGAGAVAQLARRASGAAPIRLVQDNGDGSALFELLP